MQQTLVESTEKCKNIGIRYLYEGGDKKKLVGKHEADNQKGAIVRNGMERTMHADWSRWSGRHSEGLLS